MPGVNSPLPRQALAEERQIDHQCTAACSIHPWSPAPPISWKRKLRCVRCAHTAKRHTSKSTMACSNKHTLGEMSQPPTGPRPQPPLIHSHSHSPKPPKSNSTQQHTCERCRSHPLAPTAW